MPSDFELVAAARRALEGSLSVVPGDAVLVLVDRARVEIGAVLVEVAGMLGARPELAVLEDVQPRPIRALPESLLSALAEVQVTILLASLDDSEVGFRRELVARVRALQIRHAHMMGVTRRSLIAGLAADPSRIQSATRAVRTRLREDSTLQLRTPAGSDLVVRLDPACRWIEQVGVIRPGRWENVPSGELVTTPADVHGTYVADGSIGGDFGVHAGLLAAKPVRIEIANGQARSVRCLDRGLQRDVEDFLRRDPNGDRVGTVILGTNVGRRDPLGDIIADQIVPGLHLSFGATFPDETGARWNARTQLPMTCSAADVDLDGVALLRAGRYLVI